MTLLRWYAMDGVSDYGDAVDFDIEASSPSRDIYEDSRRRCSRKILCIDRIYSGELVDLGAIHVALEHLLHRRAGRFNTELQLVHDNLRLPFDRYVSDLTRLRIKWGQARYEKQISCPSDNRCGCLPPFKICGERLHTDNFAIHDLTPGRGIEISIGLDR